MLVVSLGLHLFRFPLEIEEAHVLAHQRPDAEECDRRKLQDVNEDCGGLGVVDVDVRNQHHERDDDGDVELTDESGSAGDRDEHGEDGLHDEWEIPRDSGKKREGDDV